MRFSATYSPDDNKLRLYSGGRLDVDLYERVKAAGFKYAPRQQLFVAPMWTPTREDLLLELCEEIGDEDTTLADRAEDRADRFEGYSDRRAEDAEAARKAVSAIADNIPFGQPILVGHHSEARARRDAEKIETGMRKAIRMWETSEYWQRRAANALRHAKYKELPAVRARRIKTIEADKRKRERMVAEAKKFSRAWSTPGLTYDQARAIANFDHISKSFSLAAYPRAEPASQYEGPMGLWSALDGIITVEQARDIALAVHARTIAWSTRWIAHYDNRLVYERAMLDEAGGIVTDRNAPEKGGGVRCWASPRDGWSYVQKVNRVSVTVLDNWGNGGGNFTRTIPFDKLKGVMSATDVAEKRAAGLLVEAQDGTGFYLQSAPADDAGVSDAIPSPAPAAETGHDRQEGAAATAALRQSLADGVKVVVAPQLFPTPRPIADRVAELADVRPGQEFLEPSAGTGALVDAVLAREPSARPYLVEINSRLAAVLADKYTPPEDAAAGICRNVIEGDFVEAWASLGSYDRILMNPPFGDAADIEHIELAAKMLRPGGRLVALCAAGPRQHAQLRPLASHWEELPEGSFRQQGTDVRAALLVIQR